MFNKHENATEKFYEVGVEKFGDYHSRFLNFGLWENGITDYVKASENLLTRVANRIKLDDKSILLDVACGMGTQDSFFMETFKCASIEGLDLTAKHIELAKKHNKHPQINFVRGNACYLPYPDESFTHVMGIEGPANFNTREKFMKEAFRVLKPGGYLGLSDYSMARKPKSWWEKQLIKYTVKFWHMPYDNVQTNEEFAKTLENCGFTSVDVEVVTKSVIPGYIAENRKPENRKEIYRIRGPIWGPLSDYLDDFVEWLYKRDLVDYILVKAQKPL